jgi:hypothetical protein
MEGSGMVTEAGPLLTLACQFIEEIKIIRRRAGGSTRAQIKLK